MAIINPKKKQESMKKMVLDPGVPLEHRLQMLQHLVMLEGDDARALLVEILTEADANTAESIYAGKIEELSQLLQALREGPLRAGTFLSLREPFGGEPIGAVSHARVRLEDGVTVFPVIPEPELVSQLRRGDGVLLDTQAKAVIFRLRQDGTGEEAFFERRIDGDRVELSSRGDERFVFDATETLMDSLDRGEAVSGSRLLVCTKRKIAFRVMPAQDGQSKLRFLDRGPVPDVLVDRDLGAPPSYIEELASLVQLEMTRPELRRRYRLRRCAMRLLAGVSGSGKTFSLYALWRRIYEVMSEVTAVPIEQLPPRVFRFRPSDVLSKWFGDTDKNIARFFGEVEETAREQFKGSDGRCYSLPVLAILEEIDGLTRGRGHDALYDRILSTLLERLDPTRQELKDQLILFIATTNVPQLIDMAFLRRIGGKIERFGRLTRSSFAAVFTKHLQGMPLASDDGSTQSELFSEFISLLTSWLFSPNGEDRGQVALSFVGSNAQEIRYRRHFLTAGLVDRTVQQAAARACDEENRGSPVPGLTIETLKSCFDEQIRAIVNQLSIENASHYLELPENRRLHSLQPIEQPPVHSYRLQRAI